MIFSGRQADGAGSSGADQALRVAGRIFRSENAYEQRPVAGGDPVEPEQTLESLPVQPECAGSGGRCIGNCRDRDVQPRSSGGQGGDMRGGQGRKDDAGSASGRRRRGILRGMVAHAEFLSRSGPADSELLRREIRAIGFDDVGFAPAQLPAGPWEQYTRWRSEGNAAAMDWLARSLDVRFDPGRRFPWARSVVCVALDYDRPEPRNRGLLPRISRYAQGRDYHPMMRRRLRRAARLLGEHGASEVRFWVDDGPVAEKTFAAYAGLGWVGRHGLLVHPQRGSTFFLGVLICDLDLPSPGLMTDHCGSCRACVEACPTDAIPADGIVDARRCISYANIEAPAGDPSAELPLAGWLHGCDICQDVCPFVGAARRRGPAGDPAFVPHARWEDMDLETIVAWPDAEWDRQTLGSPLRRGGPERLRRVAARLLAQTPGRGSGEQGGH